MLECHTALCAGLGTHVSLPCRLLFQGMIIISLAAGGLGFLVTPLPPCTFSFTVAFCL